MKRLQTPVDLPHGAAVAFIARAGGAGWRSEVAFQQIRSGADRAMGAAALLVPRPWTTHATLLWHGHVLPRNRGAACAVCHRVHLLHLGAELTLT